MKLKKFLYSEKVAPYIFVIPFILSFAFFWIYPLITSVTMSFQDIGAIKSEWVGLANYQKLLKDNVFHTAIWNSTKIHAVYVGAFDSVPDAFCSADGQPSGKSKRCVEGNSLYAGIDLRGYFRYIIPTDVHGVFDRTDEYYYRSTGAWHL